MPGPIIVYYSLEGNTDLVARTIAAEFGWDLLRLVPKKSIPDSGFKKYVWGGRQVVLGKRPELEPCAFSAAGRPFVVIAAPIWAGSYAAPLSTFLDEHGAALTRVAAIFCHAGGSTQKAEKNLLAASAASELLSVLRLLDPKEKNREESLAAAISWARALGSTEA